MTIDGNFYRNDVRGVLRSSTGGLKLQQIKEKLAARNIKLDETQILEALESLIKSRLVIKTEGKFFNATFGG